MKTKFLKTVVSKGFAAITLASALLLMSHASVAQESLSPPSLGDETKGIPAVAETEPLPVEAAEKTTAAQPATKPDEDYGPLGQATITESRRESGQVYRVELEHSLGGAKQVLEENDSDGQLETRSSGLEEEVNIPKWTIGSW